mgnify:CR=1 FL=1
MVESRGYYALKESVKSCRYALMQEVAALRSGKFLRSMSDFQTGRSYPSGSQASYAAKRTGAQVSGPVPLPTEKEIVTILRAVHKYKDSREQFEQRTHKRLIDIIRPSAKTVEALTGLELPAGVEIEIKL